MSWIERNHTCVLPTYEHERPHVPGDLWRCDDEDCGQLWTVKAVFAKSSPIDWIGNYTMQPVNRTDIARAAPTWKGLTKTGKSCGEVHPQHDVYHPDGH